jgi:hypothetical protein
MHILKLQKTVNKLVEEYQKVIKGNSEFEAINVFSNYRYPDNKVGIPEIQKYNNNYNGWIIEILGKSLEEYDDNGDEIYISPNGKLFIIRDIDEDDFKDIREIIDFPRLNDNVIDNEDEDE